MYRVSVGGTLIEVYFMLTLYKQTVDNSTIFAIVIKGEK